MIYGLVIHYPRREGVNGFLESLAIQRVPYRLVVVDSDRRGVPYPAHKVITPWRRVYWAEGMNLLWDFFKTYPAKDSDVVCFLHDDLVFDEDYFANGSRVKEGEVIIPRVYENGEVVDGGIEIDWAQKRFGVGERIDCFSPRAIFLTMGDFRRSGGFRLWHYLSDYDWSMRLIQGGFKIRRSGSVQHIKP